MEGSKAQPKPWNKKLVIKQKDLFHDLQRKESTKRPIKVSQAAKGSPEAL
jgi:hypothetical protein